MKETSTTEKTFIVVYGPPGSGKSLNIDALANLYGCGIVDDDNCTINNKDGNCSINNIIGTINALSRRLILANKPSEFPNAINIPVRIAKASLGNKWIEPKQQYSVMIRYKCYGSCEEEALAYAKISSPAFITHHKIEES